MFGDGGFLDGKYTAFGEVTSGMDVIDKIKAGTEDNNGAVDESRQDRDHAHGVWREDKEQRHEQPQAIR